MFAKTIIDSDVFLDMPLTTQALYFHLSMRADDDGFVNNPKKIQKMIGASDDDMRLLLAKNFLIYFESGVVVIKHWRIHNYIQNDRYKETVYKEEKSMLKSKENKAYKLADDGMYPNCIQTVSKMDTQVSIGKVSIVEDSKEERTAPHSDQKHIFGEYRHVLLTYKEVEKLEMDFGKEKTQEAIKLLDEYIEMKGYKVKSHYLVMRKWVFNAVDEAKQRQQRAQKPEQPKQQQTSAFNRMETSGIDYDALFGSGKIGQG